MNEKIEGESVKSCFSVSPLNQAKDACNRRDNKADDHAADSGQQEGDGRPFEAFGFLFDGKAGGGAGEVHEGKEHGAQGGQPCPAVINQKLPKLL